MRSWWRTRSRGSYAEGYNSLVGTSIRDRYNLHDHHRAGSPQTPYPCCFRHPAYEPCGENCPHIWGHHHHLHDHHQHELNNSSEDVPSVPEGDTSNDRDKTATLLQDENPDSLAADLHGSTSCPKQSSGRPWTRCSSPTTELECKDGVKPSRVHSEVDAPVGSVARLGSDPAIVPWEQLIMQPWSQSTLPLLLLSPNEQPWHP